MSPANNGRTPLLVKIATVRSADDFGYKFSEVLQFLWEELTVTAL